jgi:hypothetical protein
MASSHDKGNALEEAVRAIETAILRSTPTLDQNTFTFESRKLVAVAGVRHEIDVYARVAISTGYNAVFIFECKNLKKAVGKNDIIIFSEKIDAVRAQKFFLLQNHSPETLRLNQSKIRASNCSSPMSTTSTKLPLPLIFITYCRTPVSRLRQ